MLSTPMFTSLIIEKIILKNLVFKFNDTKIVDIKNSTIKIKDEYIIICCRTGI